MSVYELVRCFLREGCPYFVSGKSLVSEEVFVAPEKVETVGFPRVRDGGESDPVGESEMYPCRWWGVVGVLLVLLLLLVLPFSYSELRLCGL